MISESIARDGLDVRPRGADLIFVSRQLQRDADAVFVHDGAVDYAVRLVMATRQPAGVGLADLEA